MEQVILENWKFFVCVSLLYLCTLLRIHNGGRGVHYLLSSVSLLDFLRMVSQVIPESHFHNFRTHTFFRGMVCVEENNLKLVFYITLLHSSKTLQHKTYFTLYFSDQLEVTWAYMILPRQNFSDKFELENNGRVSIR